MNIQGNKERKEFRMSFKLKVLDAIVDSKGKTRLRITQTEIWVIKVLTVIFSIFFIKQIYAFFYKFFRADVPWDSLLLSLRSSLLIVLRAFFTFAFLLLPKFHDAEMVKPASGIFPIECCL